MAVNGDVDKMVRLGELGQGFRAEMDALIADEESQFFGQEARKAATTS